MQAPDVPAFPKSTFSTFFMYKCHKAFKKTYNSLNMEMMVMWNVLGWHWMNQAGGGGCFTRGMPGVSSDRKIHRRAAPHAASGAGAAGLGHKSSPARWVWWQWQTQEAPPEPGQHLLRGLWGWTRLWPPGEQHCPCPHHHQGLLCCSPSSRQPRVTPVWHLHVPLECPCCQPPALPSSCMELEVLKAPKKPCNTQ